MGSIESGTLPIVGVRMGYLRRRHVQVVQRMIAELHDYQKRAVEFLHENPRAYLALRMGAGKT